MLEQKSRILCYSNANLTRADQNEELLRFVEFWHAITDTDPQWLYFDSKLTDYPELSRVNQRGIHFITIRRRGAAIVRRLAGLPTSQWTKAVIDTPKRCHQQIRYFEETIHLRGYEGPIRQIAATGLGHDQPTLFITNQFQETPREVIIRYAGRNRVEDGLGISVNFFHLDCLASEVRLNVDLDATLTVFWPTAATAGWPADWADMRKPLPSSCTAASWKLQAASRFRRIALSCISTSAATTRSFAKPPSIANRFPSLGSMICRSYLPFLDPHEN